MKAQQQQPYTPPSTQPEHGTVIESKGMNNNKYAQSETMGRRGI
jgi:hypothetical protein